MMSRPEDGAGGPIVESLISPTDLATLIGLASTAPPGDFMELGVYRGGSAVLLYRLAEAQGRQLYLYDTFAGHPQIDAAHDSAGEHYPGKYADAIDPAILQTWLPNAIIVRGEFPGTMREDMRNVAFVHSDCDLYAPTDAVCRLLPPRMVHGGLLYFDDYGWSECPGVRDAVDAAFGRGPTLPNGKRVVCVRA